MKQAPMWSKHFKGVADLRTSNTSFVISCLLDGNSTLLSIKKITWPISMPFSEVLSQTTIIGAIFATKKLSGFPYKMDEWKYNHYYDGWIDVRHQLSVPISRFAVWNIEWRTNFMLPTFRFGPWLRRRSPVMEQNWICEKRMTANVTKDKVLHFEVVTHKCHFLTVSGSFTTNLE